MVNKNAGFIRKLDLKNFCEKFCLLHMCSMNQYYYPVELIIKIMFDFDFGFVVKINNKTFYL